MSKSKIFTLHDVEIEEFRVYRVCQELIAARFSFTVYTINLFDDLFISIFFSAIILKPHL